MCVSSTLLPLGMQNGHLTPCNKRHNCAITQVVNGQKTHLQPIRYTGSKQQAMERMKKVILAMPRTDIIKETNNYVHVTFKTKLWGFIDDVECYFPDEQPIIHMRSASRKGLFDFGVNKRRLKRIKKAFEAAA